MPERQKPSGTEQTGIGRNSTVFTEAKGEKFLKLDVPVGLNERELRKRLRVHRVNAQSFIERLNSLASMTLGHMELPVHSSTAVSIAPYQRALYEYIEGAVKPILPQIPMTPEALAVLSDAVKRARATATRYEIAEIVHQLRSALGAFPDEATELVDRTIKHGMHVLLDYGISQTEYVTGKESDENQSLMLDSARRAAQKPKHDKRFKEAMQRYVTLSIEPEMKPS